METLYRGLADNSVGKAIYILLLDYVVLIDEVGFAPLDPTGTQLLFRLIAAADERRALGIASHWASNDWGRFLPEHTTTASLLGPAQVGTPVGTLTWQRTWFQEKGECQPLPFVQGSRVDL